MSDTGYGDFNFGGDGSGGSGNSGSGSGAYPYMPMSDDDLGYLLALHSAGVRGAPMGTPGIVPSVGGGTPTITGAPGPAGVTGTPPMGGPQYASRYLDPLLQQVANAPQQIAQTYGQITPPNFAAQRRTGFLTGAITALLAHGAGADTGAALQAGGAAGQGYIGAQNEDYQREIALAGARAKMIQANAQNAARAAGAGARVAAAGIHADAQTQMEAARLAGMGALQSAKDYPSALKAWIDLGNYARSIPDGPGWDSQARGQFLENARLSSPFADALPPIPHITTGYTPVTHTDQGDIVPVGVGNSTDANGKIVPGGGGGVYGNYETPEGQPVHDPFTPMMAGPRPPEIQQTAPTMPADTTEADKAQALADKNAADLKAAGYKDFPAAAAAMSRNTDMGAQYRFVQGWDQAHGTDLANTFNWNTGLPKDPDDIAKMAQAAQARANAQEAAVKTQFIPRMTAIAGEHAAAALTSAGAAARNAGTNAARLGLETEEFKNKVTQQAKAAGSKLDAKNPQNWSPVQIDAELARIARPQGGRTVVDIHGAHFVPGPSIDSTESGQGYKQSLLTLKANKQAGSPNQPGGIGTPVIPGATVTGGGPNDFLGGSTSLLPSPVSLRPLVATPTSHPAPVKKIATAPAAAAATAAPGAARPNKKSDIYASLPHPATVADAMKLPSGTQFVTPNGRVKIRP